jgi:outer membrane protein assembly factor BamB
MGHKSLGILAAALVGVNACASAQRTGPASQDRVWRTYLGSESRAPSRPDSIDAAARPVWRTDVGRGIAGSPALTEDLVVVAQVDRQVALLERATGDLVWRSHFPNPPGAGPLVDGDRIFVATQEPNGRVYALHLATGGRIWSAAAGDVAAPLAMDDSIVYAGTTTGDVLALRTGDGSRLWKTRLTGAVRAAPLPTAAGLVVATATDSLFLLDPRSGAVGVRRRLPGSVIATPASLDTLVVAATTGGELLALRADSLALAWRFDLGAAVAGSVALLDGVAYALDARGTLWRIPLADRAAASHAATGVISRAGPTPTASGVFLAGVDGDLVLVDPVTGVRRWSSRVQAPLEEPPLVDGRFFLAAGARGVVVAFR